MCCHVGVGVCVFDGDVIGSCSCIGAGLGVGVSLVLGVGARRGACTGSGTDVFCEENDDVPSGVKVRDANEDEPSVV